MKNFSSNGLSIIQSKNISNLNNSNKNSKFNTESNVKNSLDNNVIYNINGQLSSNLSQEKIRSFKEIANNLLISNPNLRSQLKKTDEIVFAENEIKNINNKIEKFNSNKLPIWEKKRGISVNIEKETSARKKILEIKKQVKEKGGLENIDLKNQKYFSKLHLDVILESTRILKEKNLEKQTEIPTTVNSNSLVTYVTDNREISMKNFLLN